MAEIAAKRAAVTEGEETPPRSAGSKKLTAEAETEGEGKDPKEEVARGDGEIEPEGPTEESMGKPKDELTEKPSKKRKSKGTENGTNNPNPKGPASKRSSEDAGKEDTKPRKRIPRAMPETFARRRCPNTVIGEHKFHAIRSVFTDDIRPLLTKYSHHEELGFQNLQVGVTKSNFVVHNCGLITLIPRKYGRISRNQSTVHSLEFLMLQDRFGQAK